MDLMETYLRQHLASRFVDHRRFDEIARANEGTTVGTRLVELASEAADDVESVRRVMGLLEIEIDDEAAVADTAPPPARPTGDPALDRLSDMEELRLRATAKMCMWQALRWGVDDDGRLPVAMLHDLVDRTRQQMRKLDELYKSVSLETFTR